MEDKNKQGKLWNGRFSRDTDAFVDEFNASITFDYRLYPYDIQGSNAHVRMLAKQGIIEQSEAEIILDGLEQVTKELDDNRFIFRLSDEDIHMAVEKRLGEIIGPVAGKLHTARSRNDQVALDIRLYLRDHINQVAKKIHALRLCILNIAKTHIDFIMPGYTHLQRAQPVLLSHHLMAYFEMFTRDNKRLMDCFLMTNVMPLGSAALAGTPFPIDREYTAWLLDFDSVSRNSLDSVSDRDFIIDFISFASILMMHISRLSEELILWSSKEFSFIEIDDDYCTGSSIMPQKKNPDLAELARGKSGRVYGHLMSILTIMKGLPLAYNKDMQEDKEPLFDTVDTLLLVIEAVTRLLDHTTFKKENMYNAAASGYTTATDLADYLVEKGLSFRDAHNQVGRIVGYAIKKNKELYELSFEEIKSFSVQAEPDIFERITIENSLKNRRSSGGTSPDGVKKAIEIARKTL